MIKFQKIAIASPTGNARGNMSRELSNAVAQSAVLLLNQIKANLSPISEATAKYWNVAVEGNSAIVYSSHISAVVLETGARQVTITPKSKASKAFQRRLDTRKLAADIRKKRGEKAKRGNGLNWLYWVENNPEEGFKDFFTGEMREGEEIFAQEVTIPERQGHFYAMRATETTEPLIREILAAAAKVAIAESLGPAVLGTQYNSYISPTTGKYERRGAGGLFISRTAVKTDKQSTRGPLRMGRSKKT